MGEPTADLPALTMAELTELAEALTSRLRVLDMYRHVVRDPTARAAYDERIATVRSLGTAVMEAGYHLRHPEPSTDDA